MIFVALSSRLDRVALGMTLAANAEIICEIANGAWMIRAIEDKAIDAFANIFGLPARGKHSPFYKDGVSVVLLGVADSFGFASKDFWDRTGL